MDFRPIKPEEMALVLDSWLKSYRTSDWAGAVPNHLWFSTGKELIANLIARGAKIDCAVVGDRVLGWVCYEYKGGGDTVLHYVYVKDPYRRKGLGRELVALAVDACPSTPGAVFYTHKTRFSKYLLPPGSKFVPEIARRRDL